VDNPAKVLAVTSAVADEGKSTTAVNLAAAFAEIGSRVLLIEGDLRRPRIAHFLGIEGAAGLSNVLAGQVEFDDVVQRWGDRSLFVLPSGALPPNPSELLGSAAMSALIAEQRRRFDMIVIDTPPLLPVTDAAVVAVKVDGTIMVVRSGGTTGAEVTRAVAALRTVDARLLGCVLTMHPVADTGSTYYYASRPHGKAKAQRRQTAPAADEFTALR
jgi:capsular exopolysaccharide synthesis family protein